MKNSIKSISLIAGLVVGSVGVLVFLASPVVGSAIIIGAIAGVALVNLVVE